jgi:hypothetical protein
MLVIAGIGLVLIKELGCPKRLVHSVFAALIGGCPHGGRCFRQQ